MLWVGSVLLCVSLEALLDFSCLRKWKWLNERSESPVLWAMWGMSSDFIGRLWSTLCTPRNLYLDILLDMLSKDISDASTVCVVSFVHRRHNGSLTPFTLRCLKIWVWMSVTDEPSPRILTIRKFVLSKCRWVRSSLAICTEDSLEYIAHFSLS